MFVGSNGPCKISLNIGGKIFRAHHDELNKGLIAPVEMSTKGLTNMTKGLATNMNTEGMTNMAKGLTKKF